MNSTALLPPRGIFVPTHLIFHPQLPASVLVTWIHLRCLAWRGCTTPPFSLPELASLAGLHPNRLQRHLAQLEDVAALSWRTEKSGKIIITFPQPPISMPALPAETHAEPAHTSPQSMQATSPPLASYFPTRILGYLSYDEDEEQMLKMNEPSEWQNHTPKTEQQYVPRAQALCASNN